MSATDSTTLHLERTFDAPAQDVFDAWTNPEVLRRWWGPGPTWRTPVAEVDLRVGGHYRLSMEDPDVGTLLTVTGEYREVRRPERLVYSWSWVEDGQPGHESTVTVEFLERDERTIVQLEHSGLESQESRERHEQGWAACLDLFAARVFAEAPQLS
jgi:uncharacterized protein YndB with AHSA1/START domain